MKKRLKTLFNLFLGETAAATTVEFMFAMPLIVFWFAGSLTFFGAYSEYNRAIKATYTVGDILSRQTEVSDTYIQNMNVLFASFTHDSPANTWVRISSIRKSGDTLEVVWSTATGNHDELSSPADIPVDVIPNLVNQETVILVETSTPFIPFMSSIGLTSKAYTNQIAVIPRFSSKLANTDA